MNNDHYGILIITTHITTHNPITIMKFKAFCRFVPLVVMSVILLAGFGFGFYSFARSCQQEAQKRTEQCTIIDVIDGEYRCKGGRACWIIYLTIGFQKAEPFLYQYGIFNTKNDADNTLLDLKNRTTIDCVIAPCFAAHSENGYDPNTCIYTSDEDFSGWIALSLIFGVLVGGALAISITVLTIGIICEEAGYETPKNSKCRACCNKYCWLFACCCDDHDDDY